MWRMCGIRCKRGVRIHRFQLVSYNTVEMLENSKRGQVWPKVIRIYIPTTCRFLNFNNFYNMSYFILWKNKIIYFKHKYGKWLTLHFAHYSFEAKNTFCVRGPNEAAFQKWGPISPDIQGQNWNTGPLDHFTSESKTHLRPGSRITRKKRPSWWQMRGMGWGTLYHESLYFYNKNKCVNQKPGFQKA